MNLLKWKHILQICKKLICFVFRLIYVILPALMISILCDVRLRTPHKFEWLTLDSCWGEDCVAPNVEDVVIKEFQNKGEYCHCWDDPDEVVRVVVKVTVPYNLGREAKTQQDDELNKVEDVKSCLSDKGWNVKARTLSIQVLLVRLLMRHFIHPQIIVEVDCCKRVHHSIVQEF